MLLFVQVLQELLGNEKKFVSVMEELLNTYLGPLENNDQLYVELLFHTSILHVILTLNASLLRLRLWGCTNTSVDHKGRLQETTQDLKGTQCNQGSLK